MAKRKIIKWEEGKMYLQPGKVYSMTGAELVGFGHHTDSDGFLIANTLTYEVNPFAGKPGTWEVHQLKPEPLVIKAGTSFKKIQERFPDAIKVEMQTNKMFSNMEILRHVYGKKALQGMVLKNTSSVIMSTKGGVNATIRAIVSIQAKTEGHERKNCYGG